MDKREFSNKSIRRYAGVVILVIVLLYVLESAIYAQRTLRQDCHVTLGAAKEQIEYRVQQSIDLLTALAAQDTYADPDLPYMDKARSLDSISAHMGYMMLCYVDEDINVCTERGKTSLASRDYMQRLFTTGEVQVTDSFAAGADGVTLNYTVAVPLYYEGRMSGCLFCAIYFDEVQELLTGAARDEGIEVTLLGARNQMMSATDTLHYGESYLDYLREFAILGRTRDRVEEDLLSEADGEGSFWMGRGIGLSFAAYSYIENTNWSIIATSSFWHSYIETLLFGLLTVFVCLVITVITAVVAGRYIPSQKARMQALIASVRSLEHKLSLDKQPDEPDFKRVLQLTSEGLTDSLTGVATRPVFVNQIYDHLSKLAPDSLAAMCFIDMDDLKFINDRYGHSAGDLALREIGYVLREYEKKFDGLVGRYGGDEFVLLLTGLRDVEDLKDVVGELSRRLNIPLEELEDDVSVHCSMGVAVWQPGAHYDVMLHQADEALYKAKHNGKGSYKIYSRDGALNDE